MQYRYAAQDGSQQTKIQTIFQNVKNDAGRWMPDKIQTARSRFIKENFNNSIIKKLPSATLEKLFPAIELVSLKSGDFIYQSDDAISFLYFPITSIISEFQILEDGKTVETAMIGHEGMLGIYSVFQINSSPNWAQVLTSGKALRIETSAFCREFNNFNEMQGELMSFISLYINELSAKVACTNHHTIEERLSSWLLMIQERCGADRLILTHEQIARSLGVQRPSITLMLQALRNKKAIDCRRGEILLTNMKKLSDISCGCYFRNKIH